MTWGCSDCQHWITRRLRRYADGTVVNTFESTPGRGRCDILGIDTEPSFSCVKFVAHQGDSVRREEVIGAPWQYWKMGKCPDCEGLGSRNDSRCYRCQGIGQVRFYDDGYIGEERTRKHPKEPDDNVATTNPGTVLAPQAKPDVFRHDS